MAIGQVSLSSSARSNLLALQNTSNLLSQTQERLSTGKKVNSSLDGASAYFSSKGFLNSANDLSNLKDSMSTAIQTLEATTTALDSITSIVEQMQGIINSALQTTDGAELTSLMGQYDDLREQIDFIVEDAIFNGTNLLDTTVTTTVDIQFNATNTTKLTISAVDATAQNGLGISAAADWGDDTLGVSNIQDDKELLQSAMSTIRGYASTFGTNNTLITTRQEFTTSMITTLQVASDNLVLADVNEEGANMQALQAQSSLGVVALGISGSQAQAILRLF